MQPRADLKLTILLPLPFQPVLPVCAATTKCLSLMSQRLSEDEKKKLEPETGACMSHKTMQGVVGVLDWEGLRR